MRKTDNNNKLQILYNADVLANWCSNFAGRSGIFFVVLNILKEFLKNDKINITLMCSLLHYQSIKKFREDYLADGNIKIIVTDAPMIIANNFPYNNKFVKSVAGAEKKEKIQKSILFKQIIKKILFYIIFYPIKKIIYYTNIPNLIRQSKNYDVYFSPCYKIPTWAKINKHLKKYTILYDAIPELFAEYSCERVKTGGWYAELIKSLSKDYDYFAISENTKRDFLKLYGDKLSANNVIVTPLACNENFKKTNDNMIYEVRKKYNIPDNKKYIFSLCTLEPRKNLVRAVRTFIEFIKNENINDLVYVLGGGHWEDFISVLTDEIEELDNYKDKIIKLGYVADEDLAPLYSGAEWFVYTSMYEGFGLPPLEAMSCGCPVITSNNSSLPEVVGDAGIMINYDNDEEHIKSYKEYYYNNTLRENNRVKGLERAKIFNWCKCAGIMTERMLQNREN